MLLLVNSCRKDKSQNLPLSKTELIAEAQSYFEDEVVNLPQLNDNNLRHKLNKTPLWDKAVIKKISLGNAVMVPIKFEEKIYSAPEGSSELSRLDQNSYLMIYKDKKQVTHMEWVTKSPYHTLNKKEKFVGTVVVEEWNGNFIKAFAYGPNKEIINLEPKEAVTFSKVSFTRSIICTTTALWGSVTVGPYTSLKFLGYEKLCENNNNPDDQGSGGEQCNNCNTEEEAINDDYITYYMDCNYDIDGTAIFNDDCQTCMEGNTGIEACPPPKEILDSVKNPCLKAQTSLALNAKTTIRTMLNNIFGGTVKFEDLDLIIKDTTSLASDIDAQMRRLSGIEYEISLNQNKLPNASKEYIVSTIYHEILHAFMESKLAKGSDGKYIIDQHQQMATDYVILMTEALQIAFPGLSNNEAWALSWGGLEKTPFYTTILTDAQRIQITSLNDKHKNKSAADKLGTYCN
ncbi:MAG: hypothetical protein EOO90_27055 [Pedobacter sp.]|nr:MAG: hypothetical protein EOO90_27055 [Pedobacter sp.]